jgi:hypothetical protein
MGDNRPFEPLIQVERFFVIAAMVRQDGQGQLRRAAPSIPPFEFSRAMATEIEPGPEVSPIDGDGNGVEAPPANVLLQGTPPMNCWTSSAVRCSGSLSN